jgi:WD40 repeat protein
MVGEKKRLIHLSFGPGGDKLAWCENTTRVEIHDLKAKKTAVLETGDAQPGMEFSPDGQLLATGGYGTRAQLWNAATGVVVRSLDMGQQAGGLTVVFSPDGKRIAVGNRNHTTRLFEVATGKLLHELDRMYTQELKFSPDGKTLAIAYVNGDVGLWDVSTGNLVRRRATGAREVYTLDWGLKGDVLVTAGLKGKIILWRSTDLTKLRELDAPEWVIRVRFSPDGSRMISSGGGELPDAQRKVIIWGLGGK